jgi:hypothetical protein
MTNGELLPANAWVLLAVRADVWCGTSFASRCSVPGLAGADCICASSNGVSVCSTRGAEILTGGAGMTALAKSGDGTGPSATAAESIDADMSEGVKRNMTASNVSTTPPGTATHPALRKAATFGPGICWTREAG